MPPVVLICTLNLYGSVCVSIVRTSILSATVLEDLLFQLRRLGDSILRIVAI